MAPCKQKREIEHFFLIQERKFNLINVNQFLIYSRRIKIGATGPTHILVLYKA